MTISEHINEKKAKKGLAFWWVAYRQLKRGLARRTKKKVLCSSSDILSFFSIWTIPPSPHHRQCRTYRRPRRLLDI